MRTFVAISALATLTGAAFGQSEPKPSFEIADVHASAPAAGTPSATLSMRGPLRQGVRWGLKNGSMVDLIAYAYRVEPDKVLGGPSWLEFDRFDVIANAEPNTPPEKLQAMLQSLLADRFKLVFHSDTKPFPGWALTAAKNPKLKDSDGSGESRCGLRMVPGPPPEPGGGPRPVGTVVGSCHNATMETFANFIRGWVAKSNAKIVDNTELKGTYDFELKFSLSDSPSVIVDAVDKQVGLKLEPIQIPTPVILVDSVNRKPTANVAEVATAFPPPPTEFEVASLKPSQPLPATGGRAGRGGSGAGVYQSDRLTRQNATLTQLINTAWNIYSLDQIVGLPKFADTDHYDLMATVTKSIATTEGGSRDQVDLDLYRPMYQQLLMDRFHMKVHYETRPMNAWVLTALKPKLQHADPAGRTKWTDGLEPGEKDPRKGNPALSRLVNCHNMTMAEFAALLPSIAPGYQLGTVKDETGLEGSWDFTLNFSGAGFDGPGGAIAGRGGAGGAVGAQADASDPSGGISLADAIGKQLGLKLELQKRPMQVLVIDHVDPKPVEN